MSSPAVCEVGSNNKNAYYQFRLNREKSYVLRVLGIFFVIGAILVAMFIYCIIKIIRIVTHYILRNREKKKQIEASLEYSGPAFAVNNKKHDNEPYRSSRMKPSEYAEGKDDYKQFQESINQSLDQYQGYNQKLKDYFEKTRDAPAPDQYDRRIFNTQDDNW